MVGLVQDFPGPGRQLLLAAASGQRQDNRHIGPGLPKQVLVRAGGELAPRKREPDHGLRPRRRAAPGSGTWIRILAVFHASSRRDRGSLLIVCEPAGLGFFGPGQRPGGCRTGFRQRFGAGSAIVRARFSSSDRIVAAATRFIRARSSAAPARPHESAGIVWTYLGAPVPPPPVPAFVLRSFPTVPRERETSHGLQLDAVARRRDRFRAHVLPPLLRRRRAAVDRQAAAHRDRRHAVGIRYAALRKPIVDPGALPLVHITHFVAPFTAVIRSAGIRTCKIRARSTTSTPTSTTSSAGPGRLPKGRPEELPRRARF